MWNAIFRPILAALGRALLGAVGNRARGMDIVGSTQVQRILFGVLAALSFAGEFQTWWALIPVTVGTWASFLRDQGIGARMWKGVINDPLDRRVAWINIWVPWVMGDWDDLSDDQKITYNLLTMGSVGVWTHLVFAVGLIGGFLVDQWVLGQPIDVPWWIFAIVPFGAGWAGTYWAGWRWPLPLVRWWSDLGANANWHAVHARLTPGHVLYRGPGDGFFGKFWWRFRLHFRNGAEWGELFSGFLMFGTAAAVFLFVGIWS